MDFLDPRKRKTHRIRLMIGYALMSIAVLMTSVILVYGASGYSYNAKSGNVVQNGLLLVDSKPSSAAIYLNSKNTGNKTSSGARLVLPAGTYDVSLKKSGYHDWNRHFTLLENSVTRFSYPLLIPTNPLISDLKQYHSMPYAVSQSPDKMWLLVVQPSTDLSVLSFDEFDTTKLEQPPVVLTFPSGLLTSLDKPNSSLEIEEWSSDNEHFLLKHSFDGGVEYIFMSRSDPTKSFNINREYNINPMLIQFKNHKADQLYIYNQSDQSLFMADIAKKTLQPMLSHVLAFNSYGSDLFSYITDQNVASGQVMARIWDKNTSYPLYTFAAGSKYLLDASQYQGHWYYVAGSDKANRINIFKDPLNALKNHETNKAIPLRSLSGLGSGGLSFSENSRFVAVTASGKVSVYDIEMQAHSLFDAPLSPSGSLFWLDSYHWVSDYRSNLTIMDFDATNLHSLIPTIWNKVAVLDKNSNHLITFAQASDDSSVSLRTVDLRVVDAPKQ